MASHPRQSTLAPSLSFIITPPHSCSYLEDRQASTLVVDPDIAIDKRSYSYLVEAGFRRSGHYLYRPNCGHCNACVPVRVATEQFSPSRQQRRAWRRNANLTVRRLHPGFHDEHFRLYRRYLAARHPGGEMAGHNEQEYLTFLANVDIDTAFVEFRDYDQLLAVAVVDYLERGLSAIYTFFDPDCGSRSLGVYTILWQIEEARRLGLPWLYLGYWIRDCAKMNYKNRYRPQQWYRGGRWEWAKAAQII